jgi:hypothetical protein
MKKPTIIDNSSTAIAAYPQLGERGLVVEAAPVGAAPPPLSLSWRSRLAPSPAELIPVPLVGTCLSPIVAPRSVLWFDPAAEPVDGDLVLVTLDRAEVQRLVDAAWGDPRRRRAVSGLAFETMIVKQLRIDRDGRSWLVAIEPEGVLGALLVRGTVRAVARHVVEVKSVDHAGLQAFLAGSWSAPPLARVDGHSTRAGSARTSAEDRPATSTRLNRAHGSGSVQTALTMERPRRIRLAPRSRLGPGIGSTESARATARPTRQGPEEGE